MTDIVFPSPVPLNAHSCRCLAHFSLGLEKCAASAHNTEV
ncbi:hypothetical protein CF026_24975 [Klebsiella michiganensis]|nr:hypothetical protein [Klebsiella michiganensis]MBW6009751.1 hypothetical protein [Klebsiella sp. CVUAS 11263]MBW6031592.1 hypothetical protein [Klebsiella sp. CVUAS 11332]PEN23826.1 hypothetical protein CMQ96_12115 [Klebsiella sp. MBT K-1]PEX89009.1 hypothetical protein CRI71_06210 [Klebsiella sp. KG9]